MAQESRQIGESNGVGFFYQPNVREEDCGEEKNWLFLIPLTEDGVDETKDTFAVEVADEEDAFRMVRILDAYEDLRKPFEITVEKL